MSGQGKCNVLILSANYGIGHHQVSNALANMIKKDCPGWNVQIFDFSNCMVPPIRQVLQFGYHQLIKHFANGYKWFYEATRQLDPDSRWQRMLNRIGQQKLLDIIDDFSPDVIVCTFPNPAGVVSQLKAQGYIDTPLVTVITDVTSHNQWIHPYVDAYIVAADIVAKHLKRKGVPPDKLYATGIPLRREFELSCYDSTVWERYGLNSDLFTLMVMGGGCGLLSGVEDIIESLGALDLPMQIVVVTGTNRTLAKKLGPLSQSSRIPIVVLGYVENTAELMEISQLLLTKSGGVTIFEAMAKKLPMLLYSPLPGHEKSNTRFLLERKAAILAKDQQEVIEAIIRFVEEPSLLEDIIKAMEPIAKPHATRDAANIIIQMAINYQRKIPNELLYTR